MNIMELQGQICYLEHIVIMLMKIMDLTLRNKKKNLTNKLKKIYCLKIKKLQKKKDMIFYTNQKKVGIILFYINKQKIQNICLEYLNLVTVR